jgi:hypothetical protein
MVTREGRMAENAGKSDSPLLLLMCGQSLSLLLENTAKERSSNRSPRVEREATRNGPHCRIRRIDHEMLKLYRTPNTHGGLIESLFLP